jgi:uncharacterized membrane protein YkvA (DUF1232 family)
MAGSKIGLMGKITVSRSWSFKEQILTLYYAFKDQRTPLYARILSLSSIIYLLSPADLLPDVIPLAGYIDDLFVVPFLVNVSTKLLPLQVKAVAAEKARRNSRKLAWVLLLIVLLLIGLLVLFFYLGKQLFD